jgi:hypothetical protein
MSKILSLLMAGTFAVTLGACANPWWDRNDDNTEPTATGTQDQVPEETGTTGSAEQTGTGTTGQTDSGTGTTGQSDTGAGTDSTAGTTDQDNEAFAQAIEKCQSMQGTEYQDCVDKARKDHGQM